MTLLDYSWAYIQRNVNQYTIETPAHPCVLHTITIAKLWNQPTHPTIDEWIEKMWYYIYSEIFFWP
jgi:hypothetical protein